VGCRSPLDGRDDRLGKSRRVAQVDDPARQDPLPRPPHLIEVPCGIAAVDDDVEHLVSLQGQSRRLDPGQAPACLDAEDARELVALDPVEHRLVAHREQEALAPALLMRIVDCLEPGESVCQRIALAAIAAPAAFEPQLPQLLDDPQVESLIEQATAAGDSSSAADLWHQADVRVMRDAATFPIAAEQMATYHATQVHNFVFLPAFWTGDFSNMWLDPAASGG
jgi:hypothetical protein